MNESLWKRRMALFDIAAELLPTEREAWLAALAVNEPEHVEALKKMLHELERATSDQVKSKTPTHNSTSLLGLDASDFEAKLDSATAPNIQLHAGLEIGAWRLTQAIGQGGMGEVWLAERRDGNYEGRTAIKFLRTGLGKAELVERFLRERRLLARLTHPGIARLIDAGTYLDEPYLVMEYVSGQTIIKWSQQFAPRVADRITLILKVCRATEYAHNQLVVHRDLKPSNILVNDAGEPSLLDFGIAKLIEDEDAGVDNDTALTRLTGRGYTLGYCAPEQILGEPTGVASDVFSIGVLLFEMLSGGLPFQPAQPGRAALEHAIVHSDALSLHSVLDRQAAVTVAADDIATGDALKLRPIDVDKTRGDLELIIAKTLRKNPEDRYPSVHALASDLDAWLNQKPISIRGEERSYRTRLWLQRNWKFASLASTAVLAIAVGLGFSLWQRSEALAEAARATKVATYLGELIQSASPDNHGGSWPTVLALLEQSEKDLDKVFADDPKTHALLLMQLADTNDALNRDTVALAQLTQLQKLIDQTQAADSDDALDVRKHRAQILRRLNLYQEALDTEEILLPKFAKRYGKNSEEYGKLLTGSSGSLAGVGRMDEAKRRLMEGASILSRLYPNDLAKRVDLVNDSAVLLTQKAMWREAIETLSTIEKDLPAFAKLGGQHIRDALIMRFNLEAIRIRIGRYDGVEARLKQLILENDQLYGKDNQQSAGAMDTLASLACETGRFHDCLKLRREITAMRQRQVGVDPGSILSAQLDQLSIELKLGKLSQTEALRQLNALWLAIPKSLSDATAQRAYYYRQLADAACEAHAFELAELAQKKGWADLAAVNNTNPATAAQLDRSAGLLAFLRGDAKSAVQLLDARFRQYARVAEGDTPRHATLWLQKAMYELEFDSKAAASSLAEARNMFQRIGSTSPHWLALMAYADTRIDPKTANDVSKLRAAEDEVDIAYQRSRPTPWRMPQLNSL